MDHDLAHDMAIRDIDNEYLRAIQRASVMGRRPPLEAAEPPEGPSVLALLRNPSLRAQSAVPIREKETQR